MMPVLSSSFSLEHAQVDGSRWCREVHETTRGPREFYYLCGADADPEAIMQARVEQVSRSLADDEIVENFARDAAPTFEDCTEAEFAQHMRDRFAQSEGTETCRIAWWLKRRIEDGSLTVPQCAYNMGLTEEGFAEFANGPLNQMASLWGAIVQVRGL